VKSTVAAALGAAILVAGSAQAAEVTGTTLDLGYSTVSSTNLSKLGFGAAIEVGITPGFALQFDIGAYDFEALNDNGYSLGAHAIVHVGPATSLGVFAALDNAAGTNEEFLGVEAAHEFALVEGQAYFAKGGSAGVDADVFGLGLSYGLTPQFGVTGSIDRAKLDNNATLTSYALGVTYAPVDSVSLYAEVGSLRASALGLAGNEGFVGVGAKFDLGSDRGATFDRRGIFEFIPGL
jgi:hypothetical protein